MRKTLPILALLLVSALAASGLAGCGDSEEQARECISRAREKGKAVALRQRKLQEQGEEMLEYMSGIRSINAETVTVMKKLFQALVKLVEDTNSAAQEARAEYGKVLELDGVEEYKEYASNRIEALRLIDRRAGLLQQVGTVYEAVLDTSLAGQPVDEAAVTNILKPIIEERDRLAGEIDKLNEQAAGIAEELGI